MFLLLLHPYRKTGVPVLDAEQETLWNIMRENKVPVRRTVHLKFTSMNGQLHALAIQVHDHGASVPGLGHLVETRVPMSHTIDVHIAIILRAVAT